MNNIVLPILIILADIVLVVCTVLVINKNNYLDELTKSNISEAGMRKLLKRVRRNETYRIMRANPIKMNWFDKLQLVFIDKSNIRRFLPFMSINLLLLIMLMIFISAFVIIQKMLYFAPTALVISALISLAPCFGLDILARYNSEIVRKRLAEFISILNRWCRVKEDIFYAFEKSVDSGIGEPLRSFVEEMVIQIDRGINPEDALDILELKVDNALFKDFILNIKQSIKHRGNINVLLANLENQFYKMEEEYFRRRISTYKDRLMIFFVMIGVLVSAYYFINTSPGVEAFYIESMNGKLLMALFSVVYAAGIYLALGIGRFKY